MKISPHVAMPACRVLLTRRGCRVRIAKIPPTNAYTAQINANSSANEPNTSTESLFPRVNPHTTRYKTAVAEGHGTSCPFLLHRTLRARIARHTGGLRRWIGRGRRFILRRALRLNLLRRKMPVPLEAALDQRLRFINESVRQRIAPDVTHRKLLPFAIEHKIHASLRPANAPRLDRSADANPVRPRIALQRPKLGNGVVVRFAFAIAQPRQKAHRHDDDADSDPEFGLFFHSVETPEVPRAHSAGRALQYGKTDSSIALHPSTGPIDQRTASALYRLPTTHYCVNKANPLAPVAPACPERSEGHLAGVFPQ